MLRAFGLALLTCLAIVAPARADFSYADQAPASDPLSVQMEQIALNFWHARGVGLDACPSGVRYFIAPDLTGDDGGAGGRGGDCEAWLLQRPHYDEQLALLAKDGPYLRSALVRECSTWVHETGHALGLQHSPGGVMDPTRRVVPWDCEHFARQAVRERGWRMRRAGR